MKNILSFEASGFAFVVPGTPAGIAHSIVSPIRVAKRLNREGFSNLMYCENDQYMTPIITGNGNITKFNICDSNEDKVMESFHVAKCDDIERSSIGDIEVTHIKDKKYNLSLRVEDDVDLFILESISMFGRALSSKETISSEISALEDIGFELNPDYTEAIVELEVDPIIRMTSEIQNASNQIYVSVILTDTQNDMEVGRLVIRFNKINFHNTVEIQKNSTMVRTEMFNIVSE
ncbi:MAG: hypothetical protein ACRC92_27040 [Peptostreptococcaceae bacterium]